MKVNDTVYFFAYNNLYEGNIEEIFDDHITVKMTIGGTRGVRNGYYFATKEECIADQNAKDIAYKQKIKQSIKSVNDLFHFALNTCVAPAEEYTDWVAREAVIEKAVELGVKF